MRSAGSGRSRPRRRRRIEEAIAALGYRPNAVAQRLAAGRSGAIAFVYPLDGEQPGGDEVRVLAAASAAVSEAGYALVLFAGGGAGALQPFLEGGMLDGAIVGRVGMRDERVSLLCDAGIPFVMAGRTADNAGLSFVDVDVESAVETCVERLAGAGHNCMAFLHGARTAARRRAGQLQAYERACARRRLRLHAPRCPVSGAGVRDVTTALLNQQPDLTALVVTGDAAAWGACQAALALGRRVPEDLSLVCLGKTGLGEMLAFDPTGMDLRAAEQAGQAAGMLLEMLREAQPGDRQMLLEPEWVDGETLAPAPDMPEMMPR